MKIVFTGAQGVGKTTLLDVLEKCFTFNMNFNFIYNFTRNIAKKGYQINEAGTDDTQRVVMELHQEIVESAEDIIMDRCVLDGFVYTTYLKNKNQISEDTFNYCRKVFESCIHKYDVIFYLKPEFPITGDEYRSDKRDYQTEIANIFEDIIQYYNINTIKLTGTVGDRIQKIKQTLGEIIKC